MRAFVRLGLFVAIAGAAGCLFTADFDRFDTSPAVEVTEAGPPAVISGKVALTVVGARPIVVRPGVPSTVTVRAERSGNAPAAGVRVRLENPPGGITATEAVIEAGATEASITMTVTSAAAIAPILGRIVDVNVVGSTDDPNVTSVSSSSLSIDVWGAPGQVDPTRGSGALAFDTTKAADDQTISKVPVHIADFSGTTLAVAVVDELFTLDATGKTVKTVVGVPDAGTLLTSATVLADGDELNVVTTRISDVTLPFTFEAQLRRGPLGALVARPPFTAGGRCSLDREARRAACKVTLGPGVYGSPLRRLDGPNPGEILRAYDGIDPITILHAPVGWVLVGLRLGTSTTLPAQFVEIVDDAGTPVTSFSFAEAPGALYDGIIEGDGLIVGGFDTGRAFVSRRTWTGGADPTFGAGALVRVPGDSVVRLATTPRGVLAGTATYPAPAAPLSMGRVVRFDPKTGALDESFGEKGVVTLPGYAIPLAMKDTGTRILVAFMTDSGARVVHLFP